MDENQTTMMKSVARSSLNGIVSLSCRRRCLLIGSTGRRTAATKPPGNNDLDPVSQLSEKERQQYEHLQSLQKRKPDQEMAPDLFEFIRVNPVVEETLSTTEPPTKKQPRLPRHLRGSEETADDDDEEDDFDKEEWSPSGGRRVESMPLVERIEGFETKRTTNFSRRADRETARIFKQGDILDIYDLLKRRERESDVDLDDFVAQVYKEYGETHELPDERHQERHRYMLTCCLKYLETPVLLRDEDDGFDAVHRDKAEEFRVFGRRTDVPGTSAKLVLEDLSDSRKDIFK